MKISAVIPAAGLSMRMGAFKPMLPFAEGSTLLRGTVETLLEAGVEDLVVVTGREAERLSAHLADLPVRCVYNDRYAETDMMASARLGIGALRPGWELLSLSPADVPLTDAAFLRELFEACRPPEVQLLKPCCSGRGGHPLLLRPGAARYLLEYSGDDGLRGAVRAFPGGAACYETQRADVLFDLNTPQDYWAALEALAEREARRSAAP